METNGGIMPVMDINHGDGFGYGGGAWFMWIIVLFALMGGNGWNNNRGGFDMAANFKSQAEIQQAIADSNYEQSLRMAVNNVGNGLADLGYALNSTVLNQSNLLQRDILQGNYALDKSLTDTRYVLGNAINEGRFAQQQCCCETNRNIDAVRYENAMNTNAITKAIADDGDKTRALIVANQMQDLRDKLADRDRDLQSAHYALMTRETAAQTINAVRPFPQPSYLVGYPYGTNSANVCPCAAYNA